MDALSVLLAFLLGILSLAGLMGLIVLVSAARGAGDELGRAAVAESAPWLARLLPGLVVWVIFAHADPRVRNEFRNEIAAIVEAIFESRSTVSDRVRGIFAVLSETWSLVAQAIEVRWEALSVDPRKPTDQAVEGLTAKDKISPEELRKIGQQLTPALYSYYGETFRRFGQQIAPALDSYAEAYRRIGQQLTPALDSYAAISRQVGEHLNAALDTYHAETFRQIGAQLAPALDSYTEAVRKIQAMRLPNILCNNDG